MKKLIALMAVIVLFSSCYNSYKAKLIGFDDDGNCIELPETKILRLDGRYSVGDTVRSNELYDNNLYVIRKKL